MPRAAIQIAAVAVRSALGVVYNAWDGILRRRRAKWMRRWFDIRPRVSSQTLRADAINARLNIIIIYNIIITF